MLVSSRTRSGGLSPSKAVANAALREAQARFLAHPLRDAETEGIAELELELELVVEVAEVGRADRVRS
jgi:hypothetical protein